MGSDATARAAAISELTRAPDAAARALAAQFPGPSAWSRVPVQELPAPDELGPVPAGLARLGAAGARALVRFLDAPEAEVRYVALLTAGSLPHAELVPGVLRGLFDPEPDVSSAARAAATALRRLPRFQSALPDLRQELVAKEPERRVLAARALGMLHDRPSIEGLIGLTASDDALSAQAAAEALIEITRASFGTSTHAWMAWWAENRGRRRVQWLLAALRNPEGWLRAGRGGGAGRCARRHAGVLARRTGAGTARGDRPLGAGAARPAPPHARRLRAAAIRNGRPGRSSHRPGPSPPPAAARAPRPTRQAARPTRTARSR